MRSINTSLPVKAALGLAALGVLGLAAAQPARAGGTIDTTPQWDGKSSASFWGVPDSSVFGETITATAGLNNLSSFTFYLEDHNGKGGNIAYTANVYAWDGNEATGPSLFTSGPQNTGPLSTTAFTAITSSTGGVALTPGQKYVLFLSTDGLQVGAPSSQAQWGQTGSTSAYTGGEFVDQNNGGDGSKITTAPWRGGTSTASEGGDLAFQANFGAPVPEASSSVSLGLLLALGLGGLAIARRRKVSASAD